MEKLIPLHEYRESKGSISDLNKILFKQRVNGEPKEVEFVKDNFQQRPKDFDKLESYRMSTVTVVVNNKKRDIPYTMLFVWS